VIGLHGAWERPADKVADSFLEWFRGREHDNPFFAWVHFYDPHAPYVPPEPLDRVANGPYGGEALFADRQLGRLLDELDRSGLADETVVMVLADHGEALGEHGESEHGLLLYENTLTVPWMLRFPGGPRGALAGAPVNIADIRPTLTALLELSQDHSWQGRSLLPLLEGTDPGDPNRPLYAESYYGAVGYDWAPLYAIQTGPWKLVEGDWPQLFQIEDDPRELHDRSATEAGELRRLRRMLEKARDAQEEAEKEDEEPTLSAGQRAALQALGYVTSGGNIDRDVKPDPRDVHEAHEKNVRGRSFYLKGEYEKGAELFRGALEIDSLNVPAMLSLADCYKAMGKHAEEESLYVKVLSLDGENAPAWCNLGVLRERRGDPEGAMECYDRSVAGESTFVMAHVNRGNLLVGRDEWDEAKKAYSTAVRYDPAQAAAHFGLAYVYRHENNVDSLAYHLKLAVRFDPEMKKASDWLEALRGGAQPGVDGEGIFGY
jgi:tetratricopeptide (TPR) repeat protein